MATGTAHALASRGFPIAVMGKTGTTNEFRDAIFVGSTYGPDGITAAVRIGFDDNRSLGSRETGGRLALPVFQELMLAVYRNKIVGAAPAFPAGMEARITASLLAPTPPPAVKVDGDSVASVSGTTRRRVSPAELGWLLDPAVDALQRWRVPRAIGAALMLGVVLTGVAAVTLSLSDDVAQVVAELPDGARRLGVALQTKGEPSTLDSLRKATRAIDQTAADAAGASTAPRGVVRVQVEEPVFRSSDFLWSGSMGLAGLAGQLAMVCFLAYFPAGCR